MTQYPDGDKPIRLFTAYRCPLCNRQFNVRNQYGETLEECLRLHRQRCRARLESDGGIICKHLGSVTERSMELGGCGGGTVSLFNCSRHQFCLPFATSNQVKRSKKQIAYCSGCADYAPIGFKHSDLCGEEVKRQAIEKMGDALNPDRVHTANSTPAESPHEAE